MPEKITVLGIETNNLKNIDIELAKKSINLIIGPSGSGKSSLAYDTIAQIGQHEYMSMFADDISEPSYKVSGYSNMTVAVPIKQSNYNNNMHSTIGTYFGLNRSIAFLYAALLGMSEDFFVLNKEGNLCEQCHGLGYISKLDENRIIDYNTPLNKDPFRCWNRYKDYYSQMIASYCEDVGIDSDKTFRELTKKEKDLILWGESSQKYSVRYKVTNRLSRRTSKYYGVLTGNPMLPNMSIGRQYYSDVECECCKGKKYSSEYDQYKVSDLSIGEFMTAPFSDLLPIISKLAQKRHDERINYALSTIQSFIQKAVELNLGYLCLHRAVPTLSGGELQRLKMVQVFSTQLSDLTIVLDEPLAGLSGDEKKSIYENIKKLSAKHTIVIVDHSDIFVNDASKIIALGEKGGNLGGKLIDAQAFLKNEATVKSFDPPKIKNKFSVKIDSKVYKYHGVDIELANECMNLIKGRSGIGKSTLLREYFPQHFESYLYINQKPMMGNKNSSVATAMDIFSNISDIFAKKFSKDKKMFSNLTGNEGVCPVCDGSGYVEFGYDIRTRTRLECQDCEGTGFNKLLKKYKIKNKSIFEIWKMTIDEGIDYFSDLDPKISKKLTCASSILLGHLKIGQPTSTLSGGENIRIKLLKADSSTAKVIGVDEPFKGLSTSEIHSVAEFLDSLRKKKKTIVVVDHTEGAEKYFSLCMELKNNDSILSV